MSKTSEVETFGNKWLTILENIRGLLLPFFKYFSVRNAVLQATHLVRHFELSLLMQQLWWHGRKEGVFLFLKGNMCFRFEGKTQTET